MEHLYDQLEQYSNEDYYPMHMPGHKRNTDLMDMVNPYAIDITEIEGFDNLHHAEGILRELSERITKLYGSKEAFPLVNGSTAGILAGISAATNYGDKILVARNCHKSVYHAIAMKGLKPIYYYPPLLEGTPVNGRVLCEEIEVILKQQEEIKLVVITSPSFEGVVSDISRLSGIVHEYGAYLMVDEAHGAHFGFHEGFPESAITHGADIIIQSLHKTLPSFTQTAVLHLNHLQISKRIKQYLSIYQSSSPSYILLSGIDRCITLLETRREELFEAYDQKLRDFYQQMKKLKNLKILMSDSSQSREHFVMDPSKIIIMVHNTNLGGHALHRMLYEKYHIVMEMETPYYVLGMTSIADKAEGFKRLSKALLEIDKMVQIISDDSGYEYSIRPKEVLLLSKAMELEHGILPLKKSIGRICGAYICMYPPGSPLLVPGELIEEDIILYIEQIISNHITITGLSEEGYIEVLQENVI